MARFIGDNVWEQTFDRQDKVIEFVGEVWRGHAPGQIRVELYPNKDGTTSVRVTNLTKKRKKDK